MFQQYSISLIACVCVYVCTGYIRKSDLKIRPVELNRLGIRGALGLPDTLVYKASGLITWLHRFLMKTYAYVLMSPSKTVHCLGGMNTVNVHHNIVSSTCI